MSKKKPAYGPEDRVFPTASDELLWESVYARIREDYPERALPEHVRRAFETVCQQLDDYVPFKDFLRKVRLEWLWKRPPAPRGMLDLQ